MAEKGGSIRYHSYFTLEMELDTTERPTLTRFERARCIGARAAQIADGAFVESDGDLCQADQLAVATAEFVAGQSPLVIQRVDGTVDMSEAVELRSATLLQMKLRNGVSPTQCTYVVHPVVRNTDRARGGRARHQREVHCRNVAGQF